MEKRDMSKLKYSNVQAGDLLVTDGGFTCLKKEQITPVRQCKQKQKPYINCRKGKHYLDEQVDDDGYLVGLRAIVDSDLVKDTG
jgi:hypothetical protein